MSGASRLEPVEKVVTQSVVHAHLDQDAIRVFHGPDLVTTVPCTTRKDLVVGKSCENHRRKVV